MPFSPRLTKRPSEFHVRIPAMLVASGFCKALTHYPCFEHRYDPLCSSTALRRDGDEDEEVFLLRTAPSTGGAEQWNEDSDPSVDGGRASLTWIRNWRKYYSEIRAIFMLCI